MPTVLTLSPAIPHGKIIRDYHVNDDSFKHNKTHHHEEEHNHNHTTPENQKSYFPLIHLFKEIKPRTKLESFGKQLLMMSSNLLPALTVSEVLDAAGKTINADLVFDFLKPIGAITSRQGIIDGINKNNSHKAVLASASAVVLLGANKFFNMPRFLLRPLLAVLLFGIEESGKVKELMGFKKAEDKECTSNKCNHKHNHDHKSSWGQLFTGLGILEVQLNTIAPIVSKLSSKVFESTNFVTRASKILFNTLFLSLGFTGLGEGLKYATKHLSTSETNWLKDLSKVIANTMCGCCGAVGACANAAAEDISATY